MNTFEDLHARYDSLQDDKVAEVLKNSGEYTEEAVSAARTVLLGRGWSDAACDELGQREAAKRAEEAEAARPVKGDTAHMLFWTCLIPIPLFEIFWILDPKASPRTKTAARRVLKIKGVLLGLLLLAVVLAAVY